MIVKTDCGTDGSFYRTTGASPDCGPVRHGPAGPGGEHGLGHEVAEPRLVAAADEQQLTRRAHHRAGQPVQLGTPRRQLGLYDGVLQILQILL